MAVASLAPATTPPTSFTSQVTFTSHCAAQPRDSRAGRSGRAISLVARSSSEWRFGSSRLYVGRFEPRYSRGAAVKAYSAGLLHRTCHGGDESRKSRLFSPEPAVQAQQIRQRRRVTSRAISDPFAFSFDDGEENEEGDAAESNSYGDNERDPEEETLAALHWPALCATLASFASTSYARRLLLSLRPPKAPAQAHPSLALPSHTSTHSEKTHLERTLSEEIPLWGYAELQEQCEGLLEETAAAIELEERAGGAVDLSGVHASLVGDALRVLGRGMSVSGRQAAAVASMMVAANGMRRGVMDAVADVERGGQGGGREGGGREGGGTSRLHVLLDLLKPMATRPDLVQRIWSAVDEEGQVRDTASAEVRQARAACQLAAARAREAVARAARGRGAGGGVVEEVVEVEGRFCMVVSRQLMSAGEGSSSGLVMKSSSPSLAVIEPTSAVQLNNRYSEASAEAWRAEQAVLAQLSRDMGEAVGDVQGVLEAMVRLDVIIARARYSSWLGATRPSFTPLAEGLGFTDITTPSSPDVTSVEPATSATATSLDPSTSAAPATSAVPSAPLVDTRSLRHPLLLQQYRAAQKRANQRLQKAKRAANRLRTRPGITATAVAAAAAGAGVSGGVGEDSPGGWVTQLQAAEREVTEAEEEVGRAEAAVPVPIDVTVRRGCRVVTITGPNTGGKTAAIKAVGLAALMARCGIYVLAASPARLPLFDLVLADIGDAQSLTQSLSTFSSHLVRIRSILEAATPRSLVLLDELGAGTDPIEGAALATAVLEHLAGGSEEGSGESSGISSGGALLTMATTHHRATQDAQIQGGVPAVITPFSPVPPAALLSLVPTSLTRTLVLRLNQDARFENASVEFDDERLAPTYRLLWGIPGRSNALNIAQRLGLPGEIISAARELQGSAKMQVNEVITAMEEARRAYETDVEATASILRQAESLYSDLTSAARRLQLHQQALQLDGQQKVQAAVVDGQKAIRAAARAAVRKAREAEEAALFEVGAARRRGGREKEGGAAGWGMVEGATGSRQPQGMCDGRAFEALQTMSEGAMSGRTEWKGEKGKNPLGRP
ncbi:unnamed protein product [Closterium sp. NIES-64]|nr:unnamed protein product [Closterium sp. NIES-64]